jgi:hypothetical protein
MLTVVLLALTRRPAADARLLLAVTRVPLARPQIPLDMTVVPPNSRSVSKHGTMIGGVESLFGTNENAFRPNG